MVKLYDFVKLGGGYGEVCFIILYIFMFVFIIL